MAAANITNTTDLNKISYMKEALPIIEYNLVFGQFGQEDMMPRGDGNSFRFIRFTKLNSDTGYTANTSGDSPTWTPDSIGDTLVNVTPDFLFGNGLEWNEARQYTSWAELPSNMRKLLSVQAAEAIDKRIRDIVVTGSQAVYAGGKTQRTDLISTDYITMEDIFKAAEQLKENGGKPVSKFGAFCAVISPNTERTLLTDSSFRELINRQRPEDLYKGKLGTLAGIDFWMSQVAPTLSSSGSASSVTTVEQTLVFAEGAYGVSKIMFDNFDIVYTAPGGHGDEYKTKHKLTWKASMKAVILQDLWMTRIESAHKA